MKRRTLNVGMTGKSLKLGARLKAIPTERERDHAERAELYRSREWRHARNDFLKGHPDCSAPGCSQPARVVDHVDGHQHQDWRARFWDRSRWAPLCVQHHNAKSGAELHAWKRSGDARGGRGAKSLAIWRERSAGGALRGAHKNSDHFEDEK